MEEKIKKFTIEQRFLVHHIFSIPRCRPLRESSPVLLELHHLDKRRIFDSLWDVRTQDEPLLDHDYGPVPLLDMRNRLSVSLKIE